MKIIHGLMSFGALFLTLPTTFAQPIQGTSFSHLNWEVYCSNTGTCRAAGYQDDNHQDYPASILLTRKAGAQQALQVDFALSNNDQAFDQNKLKNIHFYINDQDYGVVSIDGSEAPLIGTLNIKQRNGLQQHSNFTNIGLPVQSNRVPGNDCRHRTHFCSLYTFLFRYQH